MDKVKTIEKTNLKICSFEDIYEKDEVADEYNLTHYGF